MTPTVIILTFNSAGSIRNTLQSIRSITDDIRVVDSGSTDATLEIVKEFGATVYHRPFVNYGEQRNWAIANIGATHSWQLHLDADERLSDALRNEIASMQESEIVADGFFVRRYLMFMGRFLRHNLAPTWHMRLFRSGMGHCETREYDQHFYCTGTTSSLKGEMIDDIRMSLSEWTSRHNRWSDAEVKELRSPESVGRVGPRLTGNAIERKRSLRRAYDSSPRFIRAFALFLYRYIVRSGWRDGKEGLIFCVLQTLWFRFLIDAKLYEAELGASKLELPLAEAGAPRHTAGGEEPGIAQRKGGE